MIPKDWVEVKIERGDLPPLELGLERSAAWALLCTLFKALIQTGRGLVLLSLWMVMAVVLFIVSIVAAVGGEYARGSFYLLLSLVNILCISQSLRDGK